MDSGINSKTAEAVRAMAESLLKIYGSMDKPGDFASLMGSVSVLQYELVEGAILCGANPSALKKSLDRCHGLLIEICDSGAELKATIDAMKGGPIPPKKEQN